ncbi:MAG: glutathione S-transferase, partial [Brevundimonas sp.]
ARIVALFRQMRGRFGADGPWLFGDWSIADAFFTPVAARLRHFQIDLADHGDDGVASAYVQTLLAQPDFRLWETEALT